MKVSLNAPLIDLVTSWTVVASLFMNSWLCLAEECTNIESEDCACQTSQHKIDLKPLIKYFTKDTPYFKDIVGTNDNAKYSFQPCLEFSQEAPCLNVAACQTAASVSYSLGSESSAKFGGDPVAGTLYVNYTGPDSRVAHVRLKCASKEIEKSALTVTGESPPGSQSKVYEMEFKTSRACVKGLSSGSILIIVFFVLLLVYVLGGMLFLRLLRGARGVEMIPNYEFWSEFPLLVKDGIVFTMNGCKTDTTYEQI